jgi:hypothetical protein
VSVTELLAQDAFIKAVAGIEQHRGCASGYRHPFHKAATSLSRRHFERLLLPSNLLDFAAVYESVHGLFGRSTDILPSVGVIAES